MNKYEIESEIKTPKCIHCGWPGRELEFKLGDRVRFPCGHILTNKELSAAVKLGQELWAEHKRLGPS